MPLTISVPNSDFNQYFPGRDKRFTVSSHGGEITHSVLFSDISNSDCANLSVFIDEHEITSFDLMGRKESIAMIDSDEMAPRQTQTVTRLGFNRVEQSYTKKTRVFIGEVDSVV